MACSYGLRPRLWLLLCFNFVLKSSLRLLRRDLDKRKIVLLVFTGHVIKTKTRNHSINKVKNLGYDR